MVTGTVGSCVLADCPVVNGEGACLLGNPPLHCENFEPEVDSDSLDVHIATPPPADSEPGAAPSSDVAEEALTPPRIDQSEETAAPLTPPGRQARKVARPSGPRREVDLGARGEVAVRHGRALNGDEAAEILAQEDATTVLIVAPPDSGKTTLLAALYESFCRGPIGPWTFAGSETLLAFMQRAWYASTSSGRDAADTRRTEIGTERPWLHLRIGRDGSDYRTLLMADLSGEYFRDVGSGQPLGEAAPIASRAGHVLHLVDAALFEEPGERRRAHAATVHRMRRLAETGAFSPAALHTVVVSKSDACPPEYADELLSGVVSAAARWLPGAPVVSIAARPADNSDPSGLDALLDATLRSGEGHEPRPPARPLRPHIAQIARATAPPRGEETA